MVARALPVITTRLRARHPAVPAEVVEHHVSAAAARLIRQARIPDYLPILIERTASSSLAGGVD
ncbi:MAG: three-helix bundle dimerization domain-containing protein [Acidimicrobiales bacterium]